MAVQQIDCSYQNDGNFSEIDLKDLNLEGPRFRMETFRASQPSGPHGTTVAGTNVDDMCGVDHLSPTSNQIFRSVDSISRSDRQVVILEIRDTIEESGAFGVRVRDVDVESESYGDVIVCSVVPQPKNRYNVTYEIRVPAKTTPRIVFSPLEGPVGNTTGLADIGGPVESLGEVDVDLAGNPLSIQIQWNGPKSEINSAFANFEKIIQLHPRYSKFKMNLRFYLRMGDFRDKSIHNGTNLTGAQTALASELVILRQYRVSLMTMGRIADLDMYKHTLGGISPMMGGSPLNTDPKPGIYTPFLAAYISNIEIYQLGLDKVNSDYGGIPMKIAPGSRLETGAIPILDSARLNRTMAELAFAFYVVPHPNAVRAWSSFVLS